jgi:Meiotically up-regulated gene 113
MPLIGPVGKSKANAGAGVMENAGSGIRRTQGFHQRIEDQPDLLNRRFVYAIWDGEFLKIGKSSNHPRLRMASLATGNPRTLELLAYSSITTESVVHRKLRKHRVRGEWFLPEGEVLALVSNWCWVDSVLLEQLKWSLEALRS